jgi:hypothetical protein
MSKIIGFNYARINDPQVRKQARESAAEIKRLITKTAEYVIEVGKRLLAVKDMLSDEEFEAWRSAEFHFKDTTCSNYMAIAEKFGDVKCPENIQPAALYRLARANVPEDLVQETLARATNGEKTRETDVRLAVQERQVARGIGGRRRENVMVRLRDPKALMRSINTLKTELVHVAPSMTRDERDTVEQVLLELLPEIRRGTPLEADELQPVT